MPTVQTEKLNEASREQVVALPPIKRDRSMTSTEMQAVKNFKNKVKEDKSKDEGSKFLKHLEGSNLSLKKAVLDSAVANVRELGSKNVYKDTVETLSKRDHFSVAENHGQEISKITKTTGKAEAVGKVEATGKVEPTGKVEVTGKVGAAGKVGATGKAEATGKTEVAGETEVIGKAKATEKTETTEKAETTHLETQLPIGEIVVIQKVVTQELESLLQIQIEKVKATSQASISTSAEQKIKVQNSNIELNALAKSATHAQIIIGSDKNVEIDVQVLSGKINVNIKNNTEIAGSGLVRDALAVDGTVSEDAVQNRTVVNSLTSAESVNSLREVLESKYPHLQINVGVQLLNKNETLQDQQFGETLLSQKEEREQDHRDDDERRDQHSAYFEEEYSEG
ncbi:hypothetical protein [Marinibactrum halimedae]|uniref:Uncharacterized protein n=1 Tax=Marinibactrum halimedae TaxID=1444977 RepID=A0AA37T455_9GAMM|nr:hypothetical protein [Marinibactrum halimedae]MCD9459072.1 hypothetical protein [Marinibactrum halimedae]GLS24673.1 hypothetical protein GCM10007877_03870 [Marinibactrum halimedae]